MIVFVVTAGHAYTLKAATEALADLPVKLLLYPQLENSTLPRATYVFTDLERVPTELLRSAAAIAQRLRERGLPVLNDPARVLSRYGLLRRLSLTGFNSFNAYRVEEGATPRRWPVFLRTEGDHVSPMPELYRSAAEMGRGIEEAVARGIPVSRMLIVEYCGEPVLPGLFVKYSAFRVGPKSLGHTSVHDTQWIAKEGRRGIATPEIYEDELRLVRDNPHWPALAPAFEAGGIDYWRADFSLVGGRVELYEINTNPTVSFSQEHPSEFRREAYRLFKENYCAALRAIDTR